LYNRGDRRVLLLGVPMEQSRQKPWSSAQSRCGFGLHSNFDSLSSFTPFIARSL